MNAGVQRRAERRWVVDQVAASAAFGVLVLGIPLVVAWRFGDYGVVLNWPVGARIALALAPVAPIAYYIYALVAFYRSRDELQQRKLTEAAVVATLIVLFGTFAWGWFELQVLLPPLHSLWTLPAFWAAFVVTQWFVDRRYR